MSDAVARLNAALEGRYRIERKLGEGGMASVYLADDLRHGRKVALKVLRPELAAVVGAERFLTEIRTTANLQHPHILPLFDSGEAEGSLFYVMPCVEGETLRDRLNREKQLPVEDAVRLAQAVASALDYAHRQGVVHRDIKPENILLQDHQALVADFGIALAVGEAEAARLTDTGVSIGTPHYMSPEQATGDQTVGPASDVYALGAVLYEMLTGEPPYTGATVAAVLGQILLGDLASATEVRRSVPENVDAVIRKALERVPADRFTSARSFGEALVDPSFRHGASLGKVASRTWMPYAVAGVLAMALLWFLVNREAQTMAQGVSRYELPIPNPYSVGGRFSSRVTVAPDGRGFVVVGREPGEGLWYRDRGELGLVSIAGTEGGYNPTFSPDGRHLAFLVGTPTRAMRTVPVTGGAPVEIFAGPIDRLGHAWGTDGFIYFGSQDGLVRIPEDGGEPESVTRVDRAAGETGHVAPAVLPNGDLLFVVQGTPPSRIDRYQIAASRLGSGQHEGLGPGVRVQYAASAHILLVAADGILVAAPFDPEALEVTGARASLGSGLTIGQLGSVDFHVSESGTLVYAGRPRNTNGELVLVDRTGVATPVDPGWVANIDALALSNDGARVAVAIIDNPNRDIWLKPLGTGPPVRLTFGALQGRPEWTPDPRMISFHSDRRGDAGWDIWTVPADGTDEPHMVYEYEHGIAQAIWSPDGRWLIFRTDAQAPGTGAGDIFAVDLTGDSTPRALLDSPFPEWAPSLSPDGRWLAYRSDESGTAEIYVVPFPDAGSARWRISRAGGQEPVWSRSGSELFYRDGTGDLVSVPVQTSPEFAYGEPTPLFSALPYRTNGPHRLYDVMPGDRQFLMVRDVETGAGRQVIVVEGLHEELRRLAPR